MSVRIVLVDDHAIVREGLRALLDADPNMSVVAGVGSAREALSAAVELRPDVVVMDINMPESNGIEATERLCRLEPAPRVLIFTMHGSSEHVYRALRAGALGYVLKESAGSEVVAAVRAVASGRRFLGEGITELVRQGEFDPSRQRGPVDQLSSREKQVLRMIVDGRSNGEMALVLSLSVRTVETYRSRLMLKLELHDVPALVRFAQAHGLD
jgi:DNA-binding NarL/FixJ family response regulator